MATEQEIIFDLYPNIKVIYKDGKVERQNVSPNIPPSSDPSTGVSSKDIKISPQISARLYLPLISNHHSQKLPIIVYYHGGAFCVASAFSALYHRFVNTLSAQTNSLIVSVDYRLAPEHLLPAAYEDSWAAFQWVANTSSEERDPWLISHGDFTKLFIAGDSAGGNIAHNIAMRAGVESLKMKISGSILLRPYFWGSKPIGSRSIEENENSLPYKIWGFVFPSADNGIDNPMINPTADNAPSLTGLGCSRLFVCTAEKDEIRERGLEYVECVKKSGWRGEVEVVDVEDEDHCFQLFNPHSDKAKDLMRCLASFVIKE